MMSAAENNMVVCFDLILAWDTTTPFCITTAPPPGGPSTAPALHSLVLPAYLSDFAPHGVSQGQWPQHGHASLNQIEQLEAEPHRGFYSPTTCFLLTPAWAFWLAGAGGESGFLQFLCHSWGVPGARLPGADSVL